MDSETRRKLLSEQELFARLAESDVAELAEASHVVELGKGDELFHKGDPGTHLYIVARGVLKAVTTSREGDDLVFHVMGPGEIIGELAIFSGGRRSATVTAMAASQLIVLRRNAVLPFLRNHPDAAFTLLAVLAERVQRLSEMVEDTHFRNLPSRLAKKLMELGDSYGEEQPEGFRIGLSMSQEELGDLVGTTRESINKQMRDWKAAGLASMNQGTVTIHDREAMELLAESES